MSQLETLFDLGDWEQVLEIAAEMTTWDLPQERRSVIGVYARMFEGWSRLRRGQHAGLVAAVETVAESAHGSPTPSTSRFLLPVAVRALVAMDEVDAAEA